MESISLTIPIALFAFALCIGGYFAVKYAVKRRNERKWQQLGREAAAHQAWNARFDNRASSTRQTRDKAFRARSYIPPAPTTSAAVTPSADKAAAPSSDSVDWYAPLLVSQLLSRSGNAKEQQNPDDDFSEADIDPLTHPSYAPSPAYERSPGSSLTYDSKPSEPTPTYERDTSYDSSPSSYDSGSSNSFD